MPNTDDNDYEPQPGPSWRYVDWGPKDHVNDTRISYQRVKATKRLLKKDISLRASLAALHASRFNNLDVHNWILLVIAAADQLQHPLDDPTKPRDPLGPPPKHALYQAARILIGPRGMVHGWSNRVPNFDTMINSTVRGTWIVWPPRWAVQSDTDGNSSYRSDSPGRASDTDARSGPRGVVPGCQPVTGDTTDSDTSSYLSDDPKPPSRLDVYLGCKFVPGSTVSRLKRFDRYVETWHRERRERRAVRRTRRWVRQNMFAGESRAADHPLYAMHTRRAEQLTAQRTRAYIEQCNKDLRRRRARERKRRKKRRRSKHDRRLRQRRGYSSSTYIINVDADQPSSQQRVRRYVKELRDQVASTWRRFYGNNLSEQPQTDFEPDSKKDGSAKKMECWITPVRWIQQQGPK